MYAVQITTKTAEFIGKYYNNGVVPPEGYGRTFLVFGVEGKPNEIVSIDSLSTNFDFDVMKNCAVFKLRPAK